MVLAFLATIVSERNRISHMPLGMMPKIEISVQVQFSAFRTEGRQTQGILGEPRKFLWKLGQHWLFCGLFRGIWWKKQGQADIHVEGLVVRVCCLIFRCATDGDASMMAALLVYALPFSSCWQSVLYACLNSCTHTKFPVTVIAVLCYRPCASVRQVSATYHPTVGGMISDVSFGDNARDKAFHGKKNYTLSGFPLVCWLGMRLGWVVEFFPGSGVMLSPWVFW